MKRKIIKKVTVGAITFSLATNCMGGMSIAVASSNEKEVVLTSTGNVMAGFDKMLSNTSDKDFYSRILAKMSEARKTDEKETVDTKENSKYADMCVAKVDDGSYVNVRKKASTDSDIVGKMEDGSVAEIISKDGEWYKIKSDSIEGYVKGEYFITGLSDSEIVEKYGTTIAKTTDVLNIREEASTNAEILGSIEKGDSCTVIEEKDDEWVKIRKDDIIGYVSKEYVNINVDFKSAKSIEKEQEEIKETENNSNATRKQSKSNENSNSSKNSENTTRKTTGTATSISEEDFKWLACLIYAEAGVEPYDGKIGVANVVMNRVKSGQYPNTIKGVITQSGQFSPYRTGKLSSEISKYESGAYDNPSDTCRYDCVKALKDALNGSNTVGGRCSFNGVNAERNRGHSNTMVIGGHMFW